MNFYTTQVNTFITKLKGLIKRISRSSTNEIQSHTLTCHRLVVQLIKDDRILDGFNGQKMRLLAYEAVLYIVEILDMKGDSVNSKQKNGYQNNISNHLDEINCTLAEVKELLKKCERESQIKDGRKSFLPENNVFTKLDKNLNQYQSQLGNILTQIQRTGNKQAKSQTSIRSQKKIEVQKDEQNDVLIEEMQRVIQKKQNRITELTSLLKQSQNEKLEIEVEFKKYQTQSFAKNDELLEQLQKMTRDRKQLEMSVQYKVEKAMMEAKSQAQRMLKLQTSLVEEKIAPWRVRYNNKDSSSKTIEAMTQQTIPSVRVINSKESAPRRVSIEKAGSVKSFRRISNTEEKETMIVSDKKIEEMIEKNQQLYMLMLCQAATIEELF